MKIGIYCLTFPSGKSYIGQSINIEKRLSIYKLNHACKSQKKLKNALSKYGYNSLKIIILEECEKEELDSSEKFWVSYFDTVNLGYNISWGGASGMKYRKHSTETKIKISKSKTGQKMKRSVEYCKMLSITRSGKNNYFYGKHPSDETRRKLSLAKIGDKHNRFDRNVYDLINTITGEEYIGHRWGFYNKYDVSPSKVHLIINGTRKDGN